MVLNFKSKVLELRTHKHQDKCGTIIDLVLISKMLDQILSLTEILVIRIYLIVKLFQEGKTFEEPLSSSMASSSQTFNELILPVSKVVIFGDSLVNYNRKNKYNINRSLNNGGTRSK